MKLVVLNNMVPGLHGGAEELANHLVSNLRAAGHEAELIGIPFSWDPANRLVEEMLLCKSMRLDNVDRVIALKFPAYLLPFDNKVIWLLHQFRQAYDLWDAGYSNIPATPEGEAIKAAIVNADNACFEGARAIFTVGREVTERLRHYNGFQSSVLRAPLNDEHLFENAGYGDYIFAGGRINSSKRQYRLVEAMAQVKSDAKLIIAGPADSPADREQVVSLVARHGLEHRVTLDVGFHSREKIANYVNGALACAYLPFQEDSYGYVTMEACQASKCVITVADSGDVLEIVREGETGFVCADETSEIAATLDRAWLQRDRTIELGKAAREAWLAAGINWQTTIAKLTA